jgi:hypothetical protein
MPGTLGRRRFIQGASSAALGGLIGLRPEAQQAAPSLLLSAYQVGPQIWVRCVGVTLTSYRAHPTQKYPYFFPFAGPATGVSLTAESCEPYPHHRSVMFACDRVNGADYWQEGLERGQIVSRGPTAEVDEAGRVVIADACEWRVKDQPVDLADRRRFTLSAPSPEVRLLEADLTLTAARDVQIARTNHSLFAVRCAPELAPTGGGTLVNSEGQSGEKATFGQKAAWCAFQGSRFDATEGVALMDHPANPWSPCPWFTRDYGFISPTPMNWLPDDGLTLAQGASLRLRYLVVGYAGTPETADLQGVYARWCGAG